MSTEISLGSEGELESLGNRLSAEMGAVSSKESLEQFRLQWLGKQGTLKSLFKDLKNVPSDKKPLVARVLNELKQKAELFIEEQQGALDGAALEEKLAEEFVDYSMPAKHPGSGSVNPIRLVERKIEELLVPFGFTVVQGPEIETEYYCFDALNIPKHHPARDMQDTFYTSTGHVLRTHTTSVQARVLEKGELPVKIISRGRVYRNETEDTSHQAMFHQYELVWLDKGLELSDLMGLLTHVLKGIYGKRRKVRFVPKFYPYTEPSIGAQIDCVLCKSRGCNSCGGAGWVTILGAGMVHENVLKEFNYDPEKVSGLAFGLGTSRLAAQFYQAPNLKTIYDNDLRILKGLS